MLLYESLIIDDVLKLSKRVGKSKLPDVEFKTRNGSPFSIDCNYIPAGNTSNILVPCTDKNIVTAGINFLASNRNVKILKGFSTLEIFGGAFFISENVVRIVGNFNLNKYSKEVPILSLIVQSKSASEDGTFARHSISFYYDENTVPNTFRITKRESSAKEVTGNNHIVNLTFFKQGVDTVYMVPSQKIISDLESKEAVIRRIGRKSTPKLEENIIIAEDLIDAKIYVYNNRLKDSQIILISDRYKRNDLF